MNGNQPHRDLSSSPVPTTINIYFFCSGRNTGPSGAKPETDVSPNSYWFRLDGTESGCSSFEAEKNPACNYSPKGKVQQYGRDKLYGLSKESV